MPRLTCRRNQVGVGRVLAKTDRRLAPYVIGVFIRIDSALPCTLAPRYLVVRVNPGRTLKNPANSRPYIHAGVKIPLGFRPCLQAVPTTRAMQYTLTC